MDLEFGMSIKKDDVVVHGPCLGCSMDLVMKCSSVTSCTICLMYERGS
jgi:hypothetical protein